MRGDGGEWAKAKGDAMSEHTQAVDEGVDGSVVGAANTDAVHEPHAAADCPKCFTELQQDRHWWRARPAGSRLVGLVISRDDMPPVVEQRDELTRF